MRGSVEVHPAMNVPSLHHVSRRPGYLRALIVTTLIILVIR